MDLNGLLTVIQQHGWPVFILIAQLGGFVYLKPHVDLILADKQKLIELVNTYESIARDALARAEEANALSNKVLQQAIATDHKVEQLQASASKIEVELAKVGKVT